ncbi:MAG TPA: hypothetical protein PLM24_08975, partial [Methanothrix sp.]|nr:hypothetical protein [Methanothrix sp.]
MPATVPSCLGPRPGEISQIGGRVMEDGGVEGPSPVAGPSLPHKPPSPAGLVQLLELIHPHLHDVHGVLEEGP